MVNNADTNYKWQYKAKTSYGVPGSLLLIFALKIGVMDPGLHPPLEARLDPVSAEPPVTCRIWLLRALEDLDDEGYIKLIGTPLDIQAEAEETAMINKIANHRDAKKSALSSA
ncbi:hypothetical protein BJY00DRAFT_294495 [Aspergillus carlsbadensis]|nr:hypothetical protein BJY00DRAFT_294495 [Aspergillus carlsbadensis]